MRRNTWIKLALCAVLAAGTLAVPAEAYAQRRAVRAVRVSRPVVVVRSGYYYSRPYWFGPYYWGSPVWWGGYYQYPYPYRYPYYWDDRASLRVQVTPRQAEVFVDGYFVGLVDDFDGWSQRLDIDPGEHEIQIFLPGHRTIREKMLFRPREGYKIQRAMEPLAAGEPEESRPVPTGPPADRYSRERARMPADERPRNEDFGSISIRVQPDDAVVIIDGERWDRPQGDARLVVDLAPGPHRIEVRREGHRPYTAEVQVRRGETTTLNVSLPR